MALRPTSSPACHVERSGCPDGRRLVLLHGFTQTGRCWAPVVDALGDPTTADVEIVAVDLPGHGGSGGLTTDLWGAAAAAVAGAGGSEGGRGTWVGYSLGARVALHVALAHPDVVDRLVLISGTAGIDDPAARAERRRSDERLAARLEAIGVPAFLDEWLALPLFAGIPPERRCLRERLVNTAGGLASSLRTCGAGTQEPLWSRLAELAGRPVLVVTGAEDARFGALGARIAASVGPDASHVVVSRSGHTPPLERPEELARLISRALG